MVNETAEALAEAQEILKKVVAEEDEAQENPEEPQAEVQSEQEFDAEKAAEAFDVTRAARKDALNQVEAILSRANMGRNVDKKETLKCLRALYMVTYMQDMLITSIMGDLVNAVRSMAKTEVDNFNLTAKIFTVSQALYKKGLVSHEEMEEVHQKITVPQLLANLKAEAEAEKKED